MHPAASRRMEQLNQNVQRLDQKLHTPRPGDSIQTISETVSSSLPNSMLGVNLHSKGSSHLRGSSYTGESSHLQQMLMTKVQASPKRSTLAEKLTQQELDETTGGKHATRSIYSKISNQFEGMKH